MRCACQTRTADPRIMMPDLTVKLQTGISGQTPVRFDMQSSRETTRARKKREHAGACPRRCPVLIWGEGPGQALLIRSVAVCNSNDCEGRRLKHAQHGVVTLLRI